MSTVCFVAVGVFALVGILFSGKAMLKVNIASNLPDQSGPWAKAMFWCFGIAALLVLAGLLSSNANL